MKGDDVHQLRSRSAEEVLDAHLRESQSGSIDDDLPHNYAPDVVILCRKGAFQGYDGMRRLNRLLMNNVAGAC